MKLDNLKDHGLLFIRIGLGLSFMAHGLPKVAGGPAKWAKLGKAMEVFGIDFAPQMWGFAASFAELAGGACLALGLATRPALTLLIITMVVATAKHVDAADGKWSHAAEAAIVFVGLFLTGPGRFSLDAKLRRKK